MLRKNSERKKNSVTKTIIVYVSTFTILWMPVNVLSTWYYLDSDFPRDRIFFIIKLIGHTMSYANSSINPIIYGTDKKWFTNSCSKSRSKTRVDINYDLIQLTTKMNVRSDDL